MQATAIAAGTDSRRTVQLVPVQMLGSRVALPAAFVRTLKLLVEALPAPSPLARASCLTIWALVARLISIAAAPSRLSAVGRCWGGRLAVGDSVHVLVELGLAQLGGCLHLQDLRHRQVGYAVGELRVALGKKWAAVARSRVRSGKGVGGRVWCGLLGRGEAAGHASRVGRGDYMERTAGVD